jgi:hypothetical protein
MAVQDGFGKVSGSESLVFAYDLKDTVNSYKGEPTVNLTTDTPLLSGWQGTFTLVDTTSKTFIIETRQDNAATTSAWRTYYWNVSSYVGLFITISANVKFVSETNCNFRDFHIGQGNTGSFPLHIAGSSAQDKVSTSIKPVSKTFMTWSGVVNATGIVGFTQWIHNVTANGGNSFLEVSNIQIESKSHATPFINGTRSATQGLLDLTGNRTIDLTNVKFDSNAQPVFDGTNDTITVGTGILSGTGDFTVEAVIQSDYQETNGTIFANYPAGNLQTFFSGRYIGLFLANSSAYLGSSPFTTVLPEFTTDPIHFLALRQGTQTRVYLNGVLKKTGSSSSTIGDTSAAFRVGTNTAGTEDFLGSIFIVKVYNRALTSTEVVNNYLKYKRQYGLT